MVAIGKRGKYQHGNRSKYLNLPPGYKHCPHCHLDKNIESFTPFKRPKNGTWCKSCDNTYKIEYRKKNKKSDGRSKRPAFIGNTKYCTSCKSYLDIEKYNKCDQDKSGRKCKMCLKIYKKQPHIIISRNKHKKRKDFLLRQKVLCNYGNRCNCCGEDNYSFLCIDHVNNDGNICRLHHGASVQFYRWIINNHYPKTLQILCANCNQSKSLLGECSHKLNLIDETKIYHNKRFGKGKRQTC